MQICILLEIHNFLCIPLLYMNLKVILSHKIWAILQRRKDIPFNKYDATICLLEWLK